MGFGGRNAQDKPSTRVILLDEPGLRNWNGKRMQLGEDAMASDVRDAEARLDESTAIVAPGDPPPSNLKNPSEVGLSSLSVILGIRLIHPSSAPVSRSMPATICVSSSILNFTRSICRSSRATRGVSQLAVLHSAGPLVSWSKRGTIRRCGTLEAHPISAATGRFVTESECGLGADVTTKDG
jgi:hypothetical protein